MSTVFAGGRAAYWCRSSSSSSSFVDVDVESE
jgi:hypothetical protein